MARLAALGPAVSALRRAHGLVHGAHLLRGEPALTTYVPDFAFTTPTAFVPLGGTAANPKTQIKVQAAVQGWHVITFSAECDVITPSGGWMDIDIQINGQAQAPTVGTADAFRAGLVPNALGGWTRPSITMAAWLNAGENTIRVLARLNGGATLGWLDDGAIVVHQ